MVLEDVSGVEFKPSGISGPAIRNAFFSAQTEMVRFIITGFAPAARPMDDSPPTPESLHAHCEWTGIFSATNKRKSKKKTTAYEPYRKFYKSRQRGLDIRIQRLQTEIRDAISGLSPSLSQLSRMDKALSEALSEASREIFAVIPKLLEQRFNRLFDLHRSELPENPEVTDIEPWMRPGGWISVFCMEMREFLLAELEVRLQPVVGMIDSLPPTIIPKYK
jgi:hypothetical protein